MKFTSSSGGTGTLTCTAQTSYVTPSALYTGTVFLYYEIREWTDSTKTALALWEYGLGSYNTSTEVLTRTKILYTWNGTTYVPKYGTATAPSAINFGTTSANIDIMASPTSNTGSIVLPFQSSSVASVSSGLGSMPLNWVGGNTGVNAPSTGRVAYIPALFVYDQQLSTASIRVTTGQTAAGVTNATVSVAIYEVGSDGLPGRRLVNFGNLGRPTSSNTTITNSALATPILVTSGWYYVALLWVTGTDTGTPGFRGSGTAMLGSMPSGGLVTSAIPQGYLYADSQTTLNDPATAPTAQFANSVSHYSIWFK